MLGKVLVGCLAGVLAAATAVAAVAIVIHIRGKITKKKLQKELAKKHIQGAIIDEINRCDNQMSLSDFENGRTINVHGDRIDKNLSEGEVIYV